MRSSGLRCVSLADEMFYFRMKAKVQSCGSTSDNFDSHWCKDGCFLAPTFVSLYLIAMPPIAFRNSDNGVQVEYRMNDTLLNVRRFGSTSLLRRSFICMLLFADNCALFTHS